MSKTKLLDQTAPLCLQCHREMEFALELEAKKGDRQMKDKEEYTTMEELLDKLEEGESLVAITGEATEGFSLHIGDQRATNTWAVTLAEMLELRKLLNKKFGFIDE